MSSAAVPSSWTIDSTAPSSPYLPPSAQQLSSPLLRQPRVLLHLLTHFIGLHDALSTLQQTCKHAQYEVKCSRSKLLEDENQIRVLSEQISKKSKLGRLIRDSICPSIYGHSDIKMALALSMFSGESKGVKNKTSLKNNTNMSGPINVLLLGDAENTAKSQFLQYIPSLSHHAIYTRADGGEMTSALIEAGEGICLIDEFEKMNEWDRSLFAVVSSKSSGASKGDIGKTTPTSQCTLIAAASPLTSTRRYDISVTFAENIAGIDDAIRAQFDLLCLMPQVNSIVHSDMDGSIVHLPADILRAYIHHARVQCHPTVSCQSKVIDLSTNLRRRSSALGGTPVTLRHLDLIIRLSQAHAQMHLRDQVSEEDTDVAIQVMLQSYIAAQKYTVMRELRQTFEKRLVANMDMNERLHFILLMMAYAEVNKRMEVKSSTDFALVTQQPISISYHRFRYLAAAELSMHAEVNDSGYFMMTITKLLNRYAGFSWSEDRASILKTFAPPAPQEELLTTK